MKLRRWIAWGAIGALVGGAGGCNLAPKTFRAIRHPAPLMRARSIGLSARQPDGRALPALVERLDDADPVVRLAAHEELKRRTGQDFGYVPWDDPEPRAGAVAQWRSWLAERYGSGSAPRRPAPPLASPQSAPVATRATLPPPPAATSFRR